jgi:subtilisin-like proprotein convertase family protein
MSRFRRVITALVVLVLSAGTPEPSPANAAEVNRLFSSGPVSVTIPDRGVVDHPLSINEGIDISKVSVGVRVRHGFVADLLVSLIGPDGTTVDLALKRGTDDLGGSDFGSGSENCDGTFTVFDDAAPLAIEDSQPPFATTVRPETPLAAFEKHQAQGTWRLRLQDDGTADVGTLVCWQLRIVGSANSPAPSPCDPRPPVVVLVRRADSDSLTVTIRAGAGTIRDVRIDRLDGATLSPPRFGVGVPVSTVTVRRQRADSGVTVQAVVTDDCGPWPTVFGGGPDAFR